MMLSDEQIKSICKDEGVIYIVQLGNGKLTTAMKREGGKVFYDKETEPEKLYTSLRVGMFESRESRDPCDTVKMEFVPHCGWSEKD